MAASTSLLPARRHLAFVLGLALAVGVAYALDQSVRAPNGLADLEPAAEPKLAPARAMNAEDRQMAEAAWAYIRTNTRPTGLVDSVAGYPSATLWDTGSALFGMVAARELGLIPPAELGSRAGKLLATLATLPMVDGRVPNKSYNLATGQMVDYNNQPTPKGIGWSALDLGRLVAALEAVRRAHPPLSGQVQTVLDRIDWRAVVVDGQLMGAEQGVDGLTPLQEGRVGYEQYGAMAFHMLGRSPFRAERLETNLRQVSVDGIQVPADQRSATQYGAHVYVLSEPYMLAGLEFGLEGPLLHMAQQVYRVQEARFRTSGQPTAATEDHLDRAPFFVYNTVWADGQAWGCVTDQGEARPQDRTMSTKAAMAWAVLFGGSYGDRLRTEAARLLQPGKGLMAGRYEAGGAPNTALTLNTNGIVLEALAYQVRGPLMHARRP